jgi:hypothetical protein
MVMDDSCPGEDEDGGCSEGGDLELDGDVAALLRRFYELAHAQQLAAAELICAYLAANEGEPRSLAALREQSEGLRILTEVAAELRLPTGVAPTVRAFNQSDRARAAGWNASRIVRVFGRWSFATDHIEGRQVRQSAAQRAAERAARRGVSRNREDYLVGLRRWLDTSPATETTQDYDAWRAEHNATLGAGESPVVTYSMLRKAFRCDWPDLIAVARGELTLKNADGRTRRKSLPREEGPHGLIGFAEVRMLLGLKTTAARRVTRDPAFPAPAYVHPRGAWQRLWKRADVERFLAGDPVDDRGVSLQDLYMDAAAVAEALGVAQITVTTGSTPRVPSPTVRIGGLQLWLRKQINTQLDSEIQHGTSKRVPVSAHDPSVRPSPRSSRPDPPARRTIRG